jgi:predicted phage terminase large subunit-like protein
MNAVVLPNLSDLRIYRARRSLAAFVRECWHIIEPARPLVWNWHIDAMAEHLQALFEGRLGTQNLLINVPPGTMKSTVVSVASPAWRWIDHGEWRGIFASGNEVVSVRDSIKCRDILDSKWYRQTFHPKWYFAKDQNAKTHYKNSLQGFRRATTSGAKVTGDRADGLFVDDPLDAAYAYSDAERQKIITWWDEAFHNRINDEATGMRCIIMQRLHEEDLAGHVLDLQKKTGEVAWTVLKLPQEFNPEKRCVTVLGFEDPRKEEGELLFPQRFNSSFIRVEKVRLASVGYAGQHQQEPAAKEGNVFKRGHIQFIYPNDIKPLRTIASWDTAFKDGQENDFSVSLVMQKFDRGILIRSRMRDRFAYPALKEACKTQFAALNQHYMVEGVVVEDKASGQSLIQELRGDSTLPVIAWPVEGDKVMRAHTVVPTWEAHRIFLPLDDSGLPEPWCEEFLEILYTFPNGRWKDDIDAMTQGITYLARGAGQGFIDFLMGEIDKDAQAKAALENRTERKVGTHMTDNTQHGIDWTKLNQ